MSVRKIDICDAVMSLAEYARKVGEGDGPVVVTADGRPVAALIPIDDDDLESLSLSRNPRFIEILRESQETLEKQGGVSSDEMRRRLGIPRRRRPRQA